MGDRSACNARNKSSQEAEHGRRQVRQRMSWRGLCTKPIGVMIMHFVHMLQGPGSSKRCRPKAPPARAGGAFWG
eukprot:8461098-Alexandrium_andersonii.AAC.1